MKYQNIYEGTFINRENRFIAMVGINGETVRCHVKNTGRLKELFIPGARVLLEKSGNPNRATKYDLISVYKGDKLINIDSLAPNKMYLEWAKENIKGLDIIRPEVIYGDSRFDFYTEINGKRGFTEVKGVTLENGGIVRFPDAPTERGLKHLEGLIRCVKEGYEASVVFVCQMAHATCFTPNGETHPAFRDKLKEAQENGVVIKAFSCNIAPGNVTIRREIPVQI